jgi:hypothetical protein
MQVGGPSAGPLHVRPEAQSASMAHDVLQTALAVSQANGAQLVAAPVHCPTAVQVEVVNVIPGGQLAGEQTVPVG